MAEDAITAIDAERLDVLERLDDVRLHGRLDGGREVILIESTPWRAEWAALAARVDDPAMPALVGASDEYLVFDGGPVVRLADRLAGGAPLPPWESLSMAWRVAGGLRALHRAGLAHGAMGVDAVGFTDAGAALRGWTLEHRAAPDAVKADLMGLGDALHAALSGTIDPEANVRLHRRALGVPALASLMQADASIARFLAALRPDLTLALQDARSDLQARVDAVRVRVPALQSFKGSVPSLARRLEKLDDHGRGANELRRLVARWRTFDALEQELRPERGAPRRAPRWRPRLAQVGVAGAAVLCAVAVVVASNTPDSKSGLRPSGEAPRRPRRGPDAAVATAAGDVAPGGRGRRGAVAGRRERRRTRRRRRTSSPSAPPRTAWTRPTRTRPPRRSARASPRPTTRRRSTRRAGDAAGRAAVTGGRTRLGLSAAQVERVVALCREALGADAAACAPPTFLDEARRGVVAVGGFAIDRFEASQDDWNACRNDQLACGSLKLTWDLDTQPATGITRAMAAAYCQWRGGRLPTPQEMVRAARGNGDRLFPWGDEAPAADGVYRANVGKQGSTVAVGDPADGEKYAAPVTHFAKGDAPGGIRNLAGNVREWTAGEVEGKAIVVGGSWRSLPHDLRVTRFEVVDPETHDSDLGVRCVYDVK
ncbi:MAG: SUMF1/EgtB/PvdO family nonheme iron enzyme [Myxococcales bacterium]|nr:SUMF1/EgtB/PvdO family nonheme iron enzyme [Myxococcales bacterium]